MVARTEAEKRRVRKLLTAMSPGKPPYRSLGADERDKDVGTHGAEGKGSRLLAWSFPTSWLWQGRSLVSSERPMMPCGSNLLGTRARQFSTLYGRKMAPVSRAIKIVRTRDAAACPEAL